ncbi:lactate utilization protein [Desulfovibrio inopinatus]|uniref:lactate utilization protein n=1 Tax=Desulfovibrio inopinatus TaxID=102109 RepID=UPI00042A39AA|nr:lactate utilization protein [Desulfovibrio inopinatus]
MNDPLNTYYRGRLEQTAKALQKNQFDAHVFDTVQDAQDFLLNTIIPTSKPKSIAFGGSTTLVSTGMFDAIKKVEGTEILDTYDPSVPRDEFIERRRQALLSDLFVTSTNAVSEDGALINLDGTGNRVAAIAFGPKQVVIVAGRNKLVSDTHAGLDRVTEIAAPVNAMRLDRKTPCTKTLHCEDCSSPERICNVWTISVKSSPPKRIIVLLVNEDIGF